MPRGMMPSDIATATRAPTRRAAIAAAHDFRRTRMGCLTPTPAHRVASVAHSPPNPLLVDHPRAPVSVTGVLSRIARRGLRDDETTDRPSDHAGVICNSLLFGIRDPQHAKRRVRLVGPQESPLAALRVELGVRSARGREFRGEGARHAPSPRPRQPLLRVADRHHDLATSRPCLRGDPVTARGHRPLQAK